MSHFVSAWAADFAERNRRAALESLTDGLVGLVAGVIEHRRVHQQAYGALAITDDQRDELARAIVANLSADHTIERTP